MPDTSRHSPPLQARAKQTYEKLLDAAQTILVEGGFEALNSNAIARAAGVTPPAFYRYFTDKHAVMLVLCDRLMAAQNDLVAPSLAAANQRSATPREIIAALMHGHVAATRTFPAGLQIMVLMRALPELRSVRLHSHASVAAMVARNIAPLLPGVPPGDLAIRARVATDMFYSVIEMLFENGFTDEEAVMHHASIGIAAVLEGQAPDSQAIKAPPPRA
ncbi:TetR/AcrR family transcriptional regulator [Pyruvatibacter mobilis]|uniref:TetR/AcrR family transcriptional regulator n=1 Tax=Pyruvatibacter mobilis TaxID=1712261 RepID=UPI003BAF0ED4